MNKAEFDTLARKYDSNVSGDIFGESSYGICFCFDMAYTLWAYKTQYADGIESSKIQHALNRAEFCPGMVDIDDILNTDVNNEYNDYTISKMMLDDIVIDPDSLQTYIDALLWYCEELDKTRGTK